MQSLHSMYLHNFGFITRIRVALAPPDCDIWVRYKLNDFIVHNTHSDPLQECIQSKVCHTSTSTYTGLIWHIHMRKQHITFQIKNHLPVILPNRIFNTNRISRVNVVNLALVEYWFSKWLPRFMERREQFLQLWKQSICQAD